MILPGDCKILALRATSGYVATTDQHESGVVAIWVIEPGAPPRFAAAPDVGQLLGVMLAAHAAAVASVAAVAATEISVEGDTWLSALASALRRLWRSAR